MVCSKCANWKYSAYIEKIYGEGTGLCDNEPKGCDRQECLRFTPRDEVSDSEEVRHGF